MRAHQHRRGTGIDRKHTHQSARQRTRARANPQPPAQRKRRDHFRTPRIEALFDGAAVRQLRVPGLVPPTNGHHRPPGRWVERSYRQLAFEATVDPLTDLSNRRALAMTIDNEMRADLVRQAGPRCSLLFLDLDRFKQFDKSGSVFRLGGDEFVVPPRASRPRNKMRHCAAVTGRAQVRTISPLPGNPAIGEIARGAAFVPAVGQSPVLGRIRWPRCR